MLYLITMIFFFFLNSMKPRPMTWV